MTTGITYTAALNYALVWAHWQRILHPIKYRARGESRRMRAATKASRETAP